MPALFTVHIIKLTADAVTLRVVTLDPEYGEPAESPSFALKLLYEPIIGAGHGDFKKYTHLESTPLAQVIDRGEYFDPDWVRKNARAFIKTVHLEDNDLEIQPTHPAWIEHLLPDMTWTSVAHDFGRSPRVQARTWVAPVAPSDKKTAATKTTAAKITAKKTSTRKTSTKKTTAKKVAKKTAARR